MVIIRKLNPNDRMLVVGGKIYAGDKSDIVAGDRTPLVEAGESLWSQLAKRPDLIRV